MRVRVGWVVTFLGFFAAACQTPTSSQDLTEPSWPPLPSGARPVSFQVLLPPESTTSGFAQPARMVINDEAEWRAFWETYQANLTPKTDPPAVGFERDQVIAALMGQRNTSGYSISIAGVFETGDRTLVRVLERSPASDCVLLQVITSPVTAVVIPRSNRAVDFIEAGIIASCS